MLRNVIHKEVRSIGFFVFFLYIFFFLPSLLSGISERREGWVGWEEISYAGMRGEGEGGGEERWAWKKCSRHQFLSLVVGSQDVNNAVFFIYKKKKKKWPVSSCFPTSAKKIPFFFLLLFCSFERMEGCAGGWTGEEEA